VLKLLLLQVVLLLKLLQQELLVLVLEAHLQALEEPLQEQELLAVGQPQLALLGEPLAVLQVALLAEPQVLRFLLVVLVKLKRELAIVVNCLIVNWRQSDRETTEHNQQLLMHLKL
jgi:hypothetical protein